MSIFHYIAASKELPLGSFGGRKSTRDKKATIIKSAPTMELPKEGIALEQVMDLQGIKEEKIVVYDTFEDAAGIYISELPDRYKAVQKHFKNPFIYWVSANFGNFFIEEALKENNQEMYKANRKCINELLGYIQRNISGSEEVEIYTCWADEEEEERDEELDMVIRLDAFNIGNDFRLRERQYILVRK